MEISKKSRGTCNAGDQLNSKKQREDQAFTSIVILVLL